MFLLLIPQIKNTTNILIDNMPNYQENVIEVLDKIGVNNEVRLNTIEKSKEFGDKITTYFKTNSDAIISDVVGLATNVVTSIINIFIGVVFAIYLIIEKESLMRQTKKVLKAYLSEEKVNKINTEVKNIINKLIKPNGTYQHRQAYQCPECRCKHF